MKYKKKRIEGKNGVGKTTITNLLKEKGYLTIYSLPSSFLIEKETLIF